MPKAKGINEKFNGNEENEPCRREMKEENGQDKSRNKTTSIDRVSI